MTENNLNFPDNVEGTKYGLGKDIREVISPNDGVNFHTPSDSHIYLTPEEQAAGVRLKRRRRCGQCGPCQVKENCNKCHYCVRKDVLKQTCVYRKCVYLRSKPKPYMRNAPDTVSYNSRPLISSPPQSLPASQSFISSPVPAPPPHTESAVSDNSLGGDATVVKNPPVSCVGTNSQSALNKGAPVSKSSSESNGATDNQTSNPAVPHTFPFSIPQPQRPFQMDNVLAQNSPYPGGSSTMGSNTIQPIPIPPSFDSPFSNNHSIMPSLSNSMEKTLTDFSNQRFSHRHLHVPFPHTIRDSQSMMNIHYPGYSNSLTEGRPSTRSPCMYGPSLPPFPSAMSAIPSMPFDRGSMQTGSLDSMDKPSNGTTYLPNNTDIFRQYPSLQASSPAYGYSNPHSHFTSPHSFPHSGYPPVSTYSGYSGFGMPPPPSLPITPAIPGTSSHFGPYSASSALSTLNQTHGCPKNGQHPPASLTLVTHQTQVKYGCINNSRGSVPSSDDPSQLIIKDHNSQVPLAVMETSENEKLEIQQEGVFSSLSAVYDAMEKESLGCLCNVTNDKEHKAKTSQQPRLFCMNTMLFEARDRISKNESHTKKNTGIVTNLPLPSTVYMNILKLCRIWKIPFICTKSISATQDKAKLCGGGSPSKSVSSYGVKIHGSLRISVRTLSELFATDNKLVDVDAMNRSESCKLERNISGRFEIFNTKIDTEDQNISTNTDCFSAKFWFEGIVCRQSGIKVDGQQNIQGEKVTVMDTELDGRNAALSRNEE